MLKIIGRISSPFPTKFGVPRQSGLNPSGKSKIIFEKEFSNPDAFRGLRGFSHIWIIWGFSLTKSEFRPTVRPPRLGGNKRMGVFSTRSPYRPNSLGLSSVKLEKIEFDSKNGVVLTVSGCDCVDGTPVYDIKPYLPYTDSHPDATYGFAEEKIAENLYVFFSEKAMSAITDEEKAELSEILSQDPRPHYQNDEAREYGFEYKNSEIRFSVSKNILTVDEIISLK